MQTYIQTFAASTTWELNIPGKYFVTLQCTNTVNVRFYKGGKLLDLGEINGLLAGLEVGPLADLKEENAFDRVQIDVTGPDTVQIGIGNGAARYNRANATVTIAGGMTGADTQAQATVTNASGQLLAAKSNRRYLLIQNNDAGGDIYITTDGTAATTAKGVKIAAGGSYERAGYCPSGAINAIGSIASNANVVVVEG